MSRGSAKKGGRRARWPGGAGLAAFWFRLVRCLTDTTSQLQVRRCRRRGKCGCVPAGAAWCGAGFADRRVGSHTQSRTGLRWFASSCLAAWLCGRDGCAGWTRTSGLSLMRAPLYPTELPRRNWRPRAISKCRPIPGQGSALPLSYESVLVCAEGFEPPTPRFQAENSDRTELHTGIRPSMIYTRGRPTYIGSPRRSWAYSLQLYMPATPLAPHLKPAVWTYARSATPIHRWCAAFVLCRPARLMTDIGFAASCAADVDYTDSGWKHNSLL